MNEHKKTDEDLREEKRADEAKKQADIRERRKELAKRHHRGAAPIPSATDDGEE